jgi:hypothetical protein
MSDKAGDSRYLEKTRQCTNCGGDDTIVLQEEFVAPGDKVYPGGTVLCAKCRTPTMITVYRWTKWKEFG